MLKTIGEVRHIENMQLESAYMRIGIIAFLHESNTFSTQPTTIHSFRQNLLLSGEAIRREMSESHHEVGGFLYGLASNDAEAIPLFAARALPSGPIQSADFVALTQHLLDSVRSCGSLDGILVAPHGATVSESYSDADGYWLSELRKQVGDNIPIIGTIDPHANVSALMVESCNALIAYRTNPHLDQRERGIEAAELIVRTVRKEVQPEMAFVPLPMAISIDRQCTEESHLKPFYEIADQQLKIGGVLSNSIVLGFPYADVEEMGSGVIAITDNQELLAKHMAGDLAIKIWENREELAGQFISVEDALKACESAEEAFCLLDMGDNVGGGSSADGTELIAAIHERKLGPAFACLFDPAAVTQCQEAGIGAKIDLLVGGKTDSQHGDPVELAVEVISFHSGKFSEPLPRHGGITEFDQGQTVICQTEYGFTLMLTSLRMVPFSLQQLNSCGLNPSDYRVLVAKGVNAPIAAYRDVCQRFIRVDTSGSTSANMLKLEYHHRRRPLYPFEKDCEFSLREVL